MNYRVAIICVGLLLSLSGTIMVSVQAANSVDIKIKGNLILNPPCEITGVGSDSIEIDFGDMVIRNISYANNRQLIPYNLKCDASDDTKVSLTVKGRSAIFETTSTLMTSNKNLGIAFASTNEGSTTIRRLLLNTDPVLFTNKNRPDIYAYPVVNSNVSVNSITAGAFDATALLEASYP
ncbi:TPA: fimbrial protein [Providencia stuartii]|nr:fimbrial protein [Providencia stuartii]